MMLQHICYCFRMFSNNIGKALKIQPGKFQQSGKLDDSPIWCHPSCNFILDVPRIWRRIRSRAAWKILNSLWKKKLRPAEEENEAKKWEICWMEPTRRVELWISIGPMMINIRFGQMFFWSPHRWFLLCFFPYQTVIGSKYGVNCGKKDVHFVPVA